MSAFGERIAIRKGDQERIWLISVAVENGEIKIRIRCPEKQIAYSVAHLVAEIIEKMIAFSKF